MFWNKKKEIKEEIKEEKEINFMYCRLLDMYYKLKTITSNGDYVAKDFISYDHIDYIRMKVKTALGDRIFELHSSNYLPHAISQYILKMMDYKSCYVNALYIPLGAKLYDDIFEVTAQKDYLKIEPQLNPDKLTGHDVDMAIYELERIIEKHYKIYKNNKNFHEKEVEKLMKRGS